MITGMNHVTLAVTNIDRSFKFYRDIVGLKPLCRWNNGAYFLVGGSETNPDQGFWFCLNYDAKHAANP
jgi:catechol 2,3-dioxygenase-like lactoylglutathione lyase family enzyme